MLTAPCGVFAVSVRYTWVCRERHAEGKTVLYDVHRLEIRSVEKADRGAAAVAVVVVDGEQNALPGCNVSWQCSSGMEGRTKGRGSIRNTWCH